jgi:hypothetical protein
MKKILEFKTFCKNYHKVNEGGGAGKDIIFNGIGYDLELKLTKTGIEVIKKHVYIDEPIDIIGYQDGRRNIDSEGLFDVELQYSIDLEKLNNLTIDRVHYYTDRLFNGYDDENITIHSILSDEADDDDEIIFDCSGYGKTSYMYGAGWFTSHLKKDTIIKVDAFDISPNVTNIVDMLISECDLKINIILKATDQMEETWNDIFFTDDEDDLDEE